MASQNKTLFYMNQFLVKVIMFVVIGVFLSLQLILWLPCQGYRRLIILYAKIFKSDFGQIVDYTASLIYDDYTSNPANCSVVVRLQLDGDIDLAELQSKFQKNVVDARIPSKRRETFFRYPELKQFQVKWMGYLFWKMESNFQIKNHIYEISATNDGNCIAELCEKILNRTYPPGRSPWELVLVKTEIKTTLIFRIHHSMADGKSVVKLLVNGLGAQELTSVEAVHPEEGILNKFVSAALLPFRMVQFAMMTQIFELCTQSHPWRVKNFAKDQSPFVFCTTSKIPVKDLKFIARRNGVSTSAVLMTAISGVLRKLEWKNTEGVPVYMILPKQNHPPTLKNHINVGFPSLPIEEMHPRKRLRFCEAIFREWRFGDMSKAPDALMYVMSTWVNSIRAHIAPMRAVPVGLSNIAGEQLGFSVCGRKCLEFGLMASFPPGSIGVGFTIFSYLGNIEITTTAKSSVLNQRQLEILTDDLESEIDALLILSRQDQFLD